MNELWIWFAVGLMPYHIRRQYTRDGARSLRVRALFWSLHIERQCSGHYEWVVQVPAIERVRGAVWAALLRLRQIEPEEA